MRRHDTHLSGDRYQLDGGLCSCKNGFAQIDTDQDASYYGNWINPTKRTVVAFVEGDFATIEFDNDEEMIKWIATWKASPDLGFKGIDPGFGEVLKSECIAHGLGPFLH